ncbi:hypothetical protein D3C81_208870 [compost metagenome]
MPGELDRMPPAAVQPERPRIWLWLYLLAVVLIIAFAGVILFSEAALHETSLEAWGTALGISSLGWGVACCVRLLYYLSQQRSADGWDAARALDFDSKLRQGRRSLQVCATSVYTALRLEQMKESEQADAILKGASALKAQSCRMTGATVRHSRLPGDLNEDTERALLNVLTQVLGDLAPMFAELPDDVQVALAVEVATPLRKDRLADVWKMAWVESGIRQPLQLFACTGLDAVDQWLDRRNDDTAVLLVMAVVLAPQAPLGTAESAVGLLLSNPSAYPSMASVATLHRPEQSRDDTPEALLRAVHQCLDWVPIEVAAVEHLWRAGVEQKHQRAVTSVLGRVELLALKDKQVHNLDALLGYPGTAAPWLASALAAQAAQRSAGAQLILSGGHGAETPLWGTVVTPVQPLVR